MAQNNNTSLNETWEYDSRVIQLSGESGHTMDQVRAMCNLIDSVLQQSGFLSGTFRIIADKHRVRGSQAQQGLSLDGIRANKVTLGYQPDGNDSRHLYFMCFAKPQDALDAYAKFKTIIGVAYLGDGDESECKVINFADKQRMRHAEEEPEQSVLESESEPVGIKKPEVFYSNDPDWVDEMLLLFDDAAEGGWLEKEKLHEIIVSKTHFENAFGISPILISLKSKGHLVESDDGQRYRVSLNPQHVERKPKSKLSIKQTQPARKVTFPRFASQLLDNELVLVGFLSALSGEMSRAGVERLIKSHYKRWDKNFIDHVINYMVQESILVKSGVNGGHYAVGDTYLEKVAAVKAEVEARARAEAEAKAVVVVPAKPEPEPAPVQEDACLLEALDEALDKAQSWKQRAESAEQRLAQSNMQNEDLRERVADLQKQKTTLEEELQQLREQLAAQTPSAEVQKRLKRLQDL